MAGLNFSDDVHATGRKLHLQTVVSEGGNVAVITLFDGGRLLSRKERSLVSGLSESERTETARAFHEDVLETIELIYEISARVKTVRHPLSLAKLGSLFLRWNLLDEAISEMELALQYDPRCFDGYLNLGEAYIRRGGLKEAVEILRKGLKLAPGYADMWQKYGWALFKNNQIKEALGVFRHALKINPTYDAPYLLIAMSLMKMVSSGKTDRDPAEENGDLDKQIRENLSRAVARSVRFQTSDFEQAMRLFHRGDVRGALAILVEISDRLPKVVDLSFHDAFYLKYLYGESRKKTKDINTYVEKMENLIKRHPKYPDLQNKMGIAYLIQSRELFNTALRHFRQACDIHPGYERAKTNLKLAENDGKGFLILLRAMLK